MAEPAAPVPAAWDSYWRETRESAAHGKGSALEPVLQAHWRDLFDRELAGAGEQPLVLDVACGNGVLGDHARRSRPGMRLVCCDYSIHALQNLRRRGGGDHTVVADGRDLPFAAGCADLVVSQFGVEYAGPGALSGAAALVTGGGVLALVLHLKQGAIHEECQRNERLLDQLLQSGLTARAASAFRAGFALDPAVAATVQRFREAERAFAPALKLLERMLVEEGRDVLAGFAQRFHEDLARLYPRMGAYELEELLAWLATMEKELEAYRQRMASMLDAGLAREQITAFVAGLVAAGWQCEVDRGLRVADDSPFAWALVLRRPTNPQA
jgi:SAM-dependent methyltransferase